MWAIKRHQPRRGKTPLRRTRRVALKEPLPHTSERLLLLQLRPNPPHERSPFLSIPPHPRHPLPLPRFGALPGPFSCPSPALVDVDPRHPDVPAFGASSLPDYGTDHTILIDTRAQPFYTRTQNSSWFHSLRTSSRTPPGGCPFPTTAAFNGKGGVDEGRSSLCSCLETQPGLNNV
jgi:hypothetical protein